MTAPALLPEDRLVEVRFVVRLPRAATPQQVEEWISHELNDGALGRDNPLYHHGLEPFAPVWLTDTGARGVERVERLGAGRSRAVRAWAPDPRAPAHAPTTAAADSESGVEVFLRRLVVAVIAAAIVASWMTG